MKHVAIAVIAATSVCAAHAQSNRVTEPKTEFSVAVPDGWRAGQLNNLPIAHVAMVAPDTSTTGANCIVAGEEIAATVGATQAKLNEELKAPFTEAFWRENVFKGFTNMKFESVKALKHPSGIRTQEATLTSDGPDATKPLTLKLTALLMVTPGMTYSATCGAKVEGYESYRKSFRIVFDSLRPKGSGVEANLTTSEESPVVTAVAAKEVDPALAGSAAKIAGAASQAPAALTPLK